MSRLSSVLELMGTYLLSLMPSSCFCLAIPALIIYLYQQSMRTDDKSFIDNIMKSIIQFYRPGADWFELVQLAFRVSFVLIRDALGLSSVAEVTFLGLVLLILLWVESATNHYAEVGSQNLSILWTIVCITLLLSDIVFSLNPPESSESKVLVSSSLCPFQPLVSFFFYNPPILCSVTERESKEILRISTDAV